MSEACNHDCANCASKCADGAPKSLLEALHPRSSVKKVIGVVSGKGGVGKSLVTALSATELHRRGYRVGVLDADVTGPSMPKAFGVQGKATGDGTMIFPAKSAGGIDVISINLLLENDSDPVVWRGPVIAGVVKQFWSDVLWEDIDFMFIDMPPGTGDVPLTVFQSIPVDGILIVTSPQDLVSMIVEKAAKMAEMMKIPILGLVENMSYVTCPGCGEKFPIFGESKIAEIAATHQTKVLAQLPIRPEIAAAVDAGAVEALDSADWMTKVGDTVEALLKK